MKLSISNIAWNSENDKEMYECISKEGFDAIEIAPTRIFDNNPYEKRIEAIEFAKQIKEKYKLNISSMQSIWYGKQEGIFNNKNERVNLINYTKKAIEFANALNCGNLVFGCPRNRNIKAKSDYKIAIDFFKEIGNYAVKNNTIFSIEPNPTIYNTNFINTTEEAINIVKDINSDGIKVNIDIGTIIQNNENLKKINFDNSVINHIHISEPNLEIIKKREIHMELYKILKDIGYKNYISIEMKKTKSIESVKQTMEYIRSVFI